MLRNFYLNKGYYNVKIESSSAVFNDNFLELYNINAGTTVEDVKLDIPIDYEKDFKDVNQSLEKLKQKIFLQSNK